jgi:hypothetical protein
MPMYGNQKQYELRYSRILTDITRTWVEGSPLPCRRVGTRAKVQQNTRNILSLPLKQVIDACLLKRKVCGATFCLRQREIRREATGGFTTREPPAHHRTDTNNRPCPHAFLSTNMKCHLILAAKESFLLLVHSPTHPHMATSKNTCQEQT